MTLIYPNIVPENNLRLPDALTIKPHPSQRRLVGLNVRLCGIM